MNRSTLHALSSTHILRVAQHKPHQQTADDENDRIDDERAGGIDIVKATHRDGTNYLADSATQGIQTKADAASLPTGHIGHHGLFGWHRRGVAHGFDGQKHHQHQ
jgi:hypothetical protein